MQDQLAFASPRLSMPDEAAKEDPISRTNRIAGTVASLFEGRDCIIWIGSGLSIGCGYPDWPSAIEQLCKACIPDKADIRPSRVAEDLMEWAEQCKAANVEEYVKTLGRLFGGLPNVIRTTYALINACPFRYLVTTNFDPCLERVRGPSDPIVTYPDLDLFSAGTRHACVYLHGKARWGTSVDASNLVLARSEFSFAYSHDTSLLPGVLEQLVAHHNLLFVGCRLSEQIVNDTFQRIKNIHERSTKLPPTRKMILLADEQDPEKAKEEEQKLTTLGIEPIRYPLLDKDNLGPEENLHRLLDDVWEKVWLKLRSQSDQFRQEGGLPT